MEIELKGLGKRFSRDWIFKDLDLFLKHDQSWAVTGPNGSGKSTLLQVISGYAPPTHGKINYFDSNQNEINPAEFYQQISIATPYLELVEEFTLKELLHFHFHFKKMKSGLKITDLIHIMYLDKAIHKQIKYFSSGMKQRLKLGLAFFSTSSVLFLDEPTTNLDFKGIDWYQENLEKVLNGRLVIICSNQPTEYEQCNHLIDILNYKPAQG
ncbi:ATP-binding cassette domain-containing protein [Cytophagales bacterium RKSG123]|nr:ATP-binding cassette domain-containing protein [Xanthovirga aplysinae]